MAHPAGKSRGDAVQLDFDRRLKLEFLGSKITSDAGLLAYRELDEALGLTTTAGAALSDLRRGRNTRHVLTGLLRQSVYSRLAGYEDVNDAERLAIDPAMRAIVDRRGLAGAAASISQMGRFETAWLTHETNLAALSDLAGSWIDRVHARKPPKMIILDMDSSESPTHGRQEGSAYNGHFGCSCYHPLFCLWHRAGEYARWMSLFSFASLCALPARSMTAVYGLQRAYAIAESVRALLGAISMAATSGCSTSCPSPSSRRPRQTFARSGRRRIGRRPGRRSRRLPRSRGPNTRRRPPAWSRTETRC